LTRSVTSNSIASSLSSYDSDVLSRYSYRNSIPAIYESEIVDNQTFTSNSAISTISLVDSCYKEASITNNSIKNDSFLKQYTVTLSANPKEESDRRQVKGYSTNSWNPMILPTKFLDKLSDCHDSEEVICCLCKRKCLGIDNYANHSNSYHGTIDNAISCSAIFLYQVTNPTCLMLSTTFFS